ncbi:MAG: hypothetical protein NTZ47_11325 [Bacteroidetes bacterium]|nr:hypothetical protein [Bacteroidota bacterium]
MRKGLFILWVFSLASCGQSSSDNISNHTGNSIIPADSAQLSQVLASRILNQYLQIKNTLPVLQDSIKIRKLASEMILLTDSLQTAAAQLPEPIQDSVSSIVQAISDELTGLQAETDTYEIRMAFQLTGLEIFQLLKWVEYRRVSVYKFRDENSLYGRGAEWLDIIRNSQNPYENNPSTQSYQVIDSIKVP